MFPTLQYSKHYFSLYYLSKLNFTQSSYKFIISKLPTSQILFHWNNSTRDFYTMTLSSTKTHNMYSLGTFGVSGLSKYNWQLELQVSLELKILLFLFSLDVWISESKVNPMWFPSNKKLCNLLTYQKLKKGKREKILVWSQDHKIACC